MGALQTAHFPRGWGRKPKQLPASKALQVLTAAAFRLSLDDKRQQRRMRALRQGWQQDAWAYRDSIGELRYAINFLAQCTSRMRYFGAAYQAGAETDSPVPMEAAGVPEVIAQEVQNALLALGNDKMAIASTMATLSTNRSVAGECWLIGQEDPATGEDTWTIRSIDEFVIYEDQYMLREVPTDPQGILGWVKLDPEYTVVSRIWTSHPRFRMLADSPMRAILDDCESLLILRRMIRATGRSRLAGRGILTIPDGLSIKVPNSDNADPLADPVLAALAEAMMEPISDEGVASAVVPVLVRGPAEALDKIRQIMLDSKFDDNAAAVRAELVGIIATGLDLPKEVITGVADLNHWSAWQVDDNTFRHHVEPHVADNCLAITGAHLRPWLEDAAVEQMWPPEWREWVTRIVLWYDPVELVTHPDQTNNATIAHEALVLSDAAFRRYLGFSDDDAPTPAEIEVRMIRTTKNYPPNLLMALMHELDPALVVPAMTGPPAIPGIKPGGVDVPVNPADGTPALPSAAVPTTSAAPAPAITAPAVPGPPPAGQAATSAVLRAMRANLVEQLGYDPFTGAPALPALPAVTAASALDDKYARMSRKLAAIDRDLRTRVVVAANAAMQRQLERAGAKLRTKVAKDETMRSAIHMRPNELVASILGREVVASIGVSATELVNPGWDDLKTQFMAWTKAAQQQAVAAAVQLAGLAADDPAAKAALSGLATARDASWGFLQQSLTTIAQRLLYDPNPNSSIDDLDSLNADTMVPMGTIRATLAVAGGSSEQDMAVDAQGNPTIPLGVTVGQIGTGSTISDLLANCAGINQQGYEWQHGPSLRPFDPHEQLDGVMFSSFTDQALANTGDWPANSFFLPGDHPGCSCDVVPLYGPSGAGDGTDE